MSPVTADVPRMSLQQLKQVPCVVESLARAAARPPALTGGSARGLAAELGGVGTPVEGLASSAASSPSSLCAGGVDGPPPPFLKVTGEAVSHPTALPR